MHKNILIGKFKKIAAVMTAFAVAAATFMSPQTVSAGDGLYSFAIKVTYGQTEARKMLDMVNEFRQGNETWYWDKNDENKIESPALYPFDYDYTLEKVAMLRALEIAVRYDHKRPCGDSYATAFEDCKYTSETIGENIAAGQTSTRSAFAFWLESKEDYDGQAERRNMLSEEFTAIGVGHVSFNGTHYWTIAFGGGQELDGSETEADDRTAERSVKISPYRIDYIDTNNLTIEIEPGEKKDLSNISLGLAVDEYYSIRNVSTFPMVADFELESPDEDILTVDDKVIEGVKEGDVELIIYVCGKKEVIPVTVRRKVEKPKDTDSGSAVSGNDSDTGTEPEEITAPKVTGVTAASKSGRKLSVTWEEAEDVSGYQVAYSTSKKFESSQTKKATVSSGTKKTVKKLKAGTKYFVRVRSFVKTSDGTVYGDWSKKVSVKIKK